MRGSPSLIWTIGPRESRFEFLPEKAWLPYLLNSMAFSLFYLKSKKLPEGITQQEA
jgi:hypothetical protein